MKDSTEPPAKNKKCHVSEAFKKGLKSYIHVFNIEDRTETINVKSGRKDEFYCRKCEQEFDDIEQFKTHLTGIHKIMSHTICDRCKDVQTSIDKIGPHMRTYHTSCIQTFKFNMISVGSTNTSS